MSNGKSQNLKSVATPKRRSPGAGRPTSAYQAWARWGLVGNGQGERQRTPPPAYTAEDHAADVRAGRVDPVEVIRTDACPRRRPELDCRTGDAEPSMRVTLLVWRRVRIRPRTPRDRPTWRDVPGVRWSCVECRYYGEYVRSQRFFREWGDHGLGYNRPSYATRRSHAELLAQRGAADEAGTAESWSAAIDAETVAAQRSQFVHELYSIFPWCLDPAALGASVSIDSDADRYRVHRTAALIRHCLRRYAATATAA